MDNKYIIDSNGRYTIYDNNTGEVLNINQDFNSSDKKNDKKKITKIMVDSMLSSAENLEDVDMKMLYLWLKSSNAFNKYNQVKLFGHWISMDFIALSRQHPLYYGYASRLLENTHTYTNILMKNKQTWITTWQDLYDIIGIKSRETRRKFKRYCLDNDIVRVDKTLRTKDSNKFTTRFIVNPYLMRKADHIGQIAVARFSDMARASVNTNAYALKYLELSGVI